MRIRRPIEREEVTRRRLARERAAFDAVVDSASSRAVGRERGGDPQAQTRYVYPPTYFRQQRWQDRQRADKQRRRHEAQTERHEYARGTADELWLGRILVDLERATPKQKEVHTKRIETVRLPEGVRAVFRGNVGESILEIMQRTGSHAQIIPTQVTDTATDGSTVHSPPSERNTAIPPRMQRGFERLTLWGSPAQNAAAIDLLPDLAQALTEDDLNASKDLKDYTLRSEETDRFGSVVEGPQPAPDEEDVLMERWHEGEEGADDELGEGGLLGDVSADGQVDRPYRPEAKADDLHPADDENNLASQSGPAVMRAVWARNPLHLVQGVDRQLSRLHNPPSASQADPSLYHRLAIASPLAFTAHIAALTTRTPRTLLSRKLTTTHYRPASPQPHTLVARTTAELTSLFTDPLCAPHISAEAVEIALAYLARHRDFPAVRRVVAALENHATYVLTAGNFDVLLAAAAREEDVHNFRYLVGRMVRRRLKATWVTWVRLHELVCRRFPATATGDAARNVVDRMRERGVLAHAQARREVVANGIEAALAGYLAKQPGKEDASLDGFVGLCDERYSPAAFLSGEASAAPTPTTTATTATKARSSSSSSCPAAAAAAASSNDANVRHTTMAPQPREWLTTSTANRMAKLLLAHGRTRDALAVVALLQAAGERPGVDTLNTFLASAARAGDAGAAVKVVGWFGLVMKNQKEGISRPIKLDERSFTLLFELVWAGRWVNMLRVVWRYACCAGMVSWGMERRVRGSLLAYVPAPGAYRVREGRAVEAEARRVAREGLRGSDLRKRQKEEVVGGDLAAAEGDAEGVAGREKATTKATRSDVFFGWAGKFAVGVGDERLAGGGYGQPPMLPPDPWGLTEHEREVLALSAQPRSGGASTSISTSTSTATATAVDDNDSHNANHKAGDDDNGDVVGVRIGAGVEEGSPPPTDDPHHQRRRRLLALLEADLGEAASLRPTVPFGALLEQAWRKDVRWKARGLGQRAAGWEGDVDVDVDVNSEALVGKTEEGVEEKRAKAFAEAFEEMLRHGIRVPMVVGDVGRRRGGI
ncbi:hypothetical protein LTR36_010946 [Oleoguttula mirabilis]|uniref:Pentatricopeptide repeat domain-containing protein n=1 Tax=Oleoguttula mirabilis TaxID=1507867 RepID=A0AAV9J3X8_9PEZI|nr:hypothetical protein LTR36_010946 [Oleoguttula mirabilis]